MSTPAANNPWYSFTVMSNELSTPKILLCPSDTVKLSAATTFQAFNGGATSYFVNGDVTTDSDPQMILTGDQNIGKCTGSSDPATTAFTVATLFKGDPWGWTQTALHFGTGNLLLNDGSVQSASQGAVRGYFFNGTNSVPAGPVYNFFQ
jgi:hypothetical protein